VVAEGTPQSVMQVMASRTGQVLLEDSEGQAP
jgi:hypothetical protein